MFGIFTAVFAGMQWYIMVADDPVMPWWLRLAVFSLLGGVLFAASDIGSRTNSKQGISRRDAAY